MYREPFGTPNIIQIGRGGPGEEKSHPAIRLLENIKNIIKEGNLVNIKLPAYSEHFRVTKVESKSVPVY